MVGPPGDNDSEPRSTRDTPCRRANDQEENHETPGRILVAAALVGGLGGAAIASALGGSNDSAHSDRAYAAAEPAHSSGNSRRLAPEVIYKLAAPSVVVISATQNVKVPATFFTPPASEKVQIGGSGFVIDRTGDVMNDHVVQGATDVRVGFSGGATYPAKVVGTDPSTDLAVIRVEAPASALHPLAFADSGHAEVGDAVMPSATRSASTHDDCRHRQRHWA